MASRERDGRGLQAIAQFDLPLLVATAGLSLLGVLLTWSATAHSSGAAFALRGGLNVFVGAALALVALRARPQMLRTLAPLMYGLALLALVAVLSPLGSTVNGSRSWIQVPGFSIQPAEIVKVALALALASCLADGGHDGSRLIRRDVRLGVVVCAIPLILVMLQPDLGSALVIAASATAAFFVVGVRRRVFVWSLAGVLVAVTLALTTPVLAPYQRDRLLVFWRPDADPSGIGYQVAQVKIAIGSGGMFGQGLFEGRSTQGGFIPYQYTDFVFSVAGEELGFVGAVGVVALETFIIVRTVRIGLASRDAFGRIVCGAVAGWLLFQTVENVGMNLGLTPVTGVPLPFVSYGGSSMFASWAAVGLVGNVHAVARRRLS